MAFDRRGDLYAVNSGDGSSVIEYDRAGDPIRQLRADANQVALDSRDDVYVKTLQGVLVYGSGTSTAPIRSVAHTPVPTYIQTFTLDRMDNLYIAYEFGQNDVVYVYGPGQLRPVRKIHAPSVCGLTTDAGGRLYLLNCSGRGVTPTVRIYAPGNSTPERTITAGLANPSSIAIDGSGYLYVANRGPYQKRGKKYVQPSISVYAPRRTAPSRTITDGLDGPIDIVFGSQ